MTPQETNIYQAKERIRDAVDATRYANAKLMPDYQGGPRGSMESLRAAQNLETAAWQAYDAPLQAVPPASPLTNTERLAIAWADARRRVVQAERELNNHEAAAAVVEQAVIEARLKAAALYDGLMAELQDGSNQVD